MKIVKHRTTVNLPLLKIKRIEDVARANGVTMSWVLRIVLRNPKRYEISNVKRPFRFRLSHRQFCLSLHEPVSYWRNLVMARESEFGPYLRKLLDLYYPILKTLDYENPRFVKFMKEIKTLPRTLGNSYLVLKRFRKLMYWPKNGLRNRVLMEFGLRNRSPFYWLI